MTTCSTVEDFSKAIRCNADIRLTSGVYRLEEPVLLDGLQNVTITGEKGTCFTCCRELSGTFQKFRDSIFCVSLEKNLPIDQVFVNRKPYVMCRYPNYMPDEVLGGYEADALSKERVARWADPTGGYVRALHAHEWGGNSYVIEGKNPDNTLRLKWMGDNNRGGEAHRKFVMVENIFEELDAPGEWFYHPKEGKLYLIPEAGTDLQTACVEYSVCDCFFELKNCKGLSIRDIDFYGSNRSMFRTPYKKVTRSDWAVGEQAAVLMEECESVTLAACTFRHIGSNCVFLKDRNKAVTVSDCTFQDCGASGVLAFGSQGAVRDLSTWENHKTKLSDDTPGPQNDRYPSKIEIKNSYFYNLGLYEKQSAAVSVSVASHVTVQGCTMHHLPRAGINVCDGSFGGHLFADNDIFDTVRETGDHGPFNSWGRDRFWSLGGMVTNGEKGKLKKPYALLDAVEPTVIRHNRITGRSGFGIDLDDGSSNYQIRDNLCCGVGIKLREGFHRTVKNNLLIRAPLDVHCAYWGSDDCIENNAVLSERPFNLLLFNKGNTTEIRHNLFIGCGKSVLRHKYLRKSAVNETAVMPIEEVMQMQFPQINFKPFPLVFGKQGAPEPPNLLATEDGSAGAKPQRVWGALVCDVDESVRTVGGLPDYHAVYVLKPGFWKLKFYGVQAGDAVYEINGNPVSCINDLKAATGSWREIKVIRKQQKIKL